ncbi:MAG: endolytic transglycosylase MltG [Deltaproteobacteria bacterium]|nr:endolytic transglycosylase MltG [Deltaproteobacteria bacterium]
MSATEAGELLADLGLVGSPGAMAILLRATGAVACMEPGPHLLPARSSPRLLGDCLCRRPARPVVKVAIPEGFDRFAVAERLEQAGVASRGAFAEASAAAVPLGSPDGGVGPAAKADTAEGYLFPATYQFPIDAAPADVVRRMVAEFERRWQKLAAAHREELEALRASMGWGRHEVVVLAPMVEKEAADTKEQPLVASVFLNRLRDPSFPRKVLQSDPTAMYACRAMPELVPACAGFSGRATQALNRDSRNPYSTYEHEGLPPGPIANPGTAALEAVLVPARSRFFYFVADGEGRHVFSVDLAEHEDAVRRLRERGGR